MSIRESIIGFFNSVCGKSDDSRREPITNALENPIGQDCPVVSIVRIENDNVSYAVEKAIDLLGGIGEICRGRERIMLKPNLISPSTAATTKLPVVKTLAQMMQRAGKEVTIGEGSAEVPGFNVFGKGRSYVCYRTKKNEILTQMQQHVFDTLGYTELSEMLHAPLINLHCGEMVDVNVPNGYIFNRITLHKTLTETDMLCSIPMMKTHIMSTVTLGMKNLMGTYPGSIYFSPRAWLHDYAEDHGSVGIAGEIIDIVRANKLGLVVIDGSMAMEGQGPNVGTPFKMDVIIAGMNALATDMVAADIMGFDPGEIPTFQWAKKAGMYPHDLGSIEIRGNKPDEIRRKFVRPKVIPWKNLRKWWAKRKI